MFDSVLAIVPCVLVLGQMGGDGGGGDGGGGELSGDGGGGDGGGGGGGDGDGGGGDGDGGGGDGSGGGELDGEGTGEGKDDPEITGTDSMVMPSAAEAEAAEPNEDRRRASSKASPDTDMVAVMTTLPAETLTLTRLALTPAAAANLLCRLCRV